MIELIDDEGNVWILPTPKFDDEGVEYKYVPRSVTEIGTSLALDVTGTTDLKTSF